ncbi:MAG: hypothetical protein R8K53_10330 [Mariprofundaceae bacterium]
MPDSAVLIKTIPESFRDKLNKDQRWHDMLAILEKLDAGGAGISEGHITIEWDVLTAHQASDLAQEAEMRVSALACICSHRPDMVDKLFLKAIQPFIEMDILYPNEIMDWLAARDSLAPEIRQWVQSVFSEKLNWIGDTVDGNKALFKFVGLNKTADIHKVAPKKLHMSNYSEIWGTGLLFGLFAIPFILFIVLSFSFKSLAICGTIVALIAFLAYKVCAETSITIDMGDEIIVRRLMASPLRYRPENIRHISLRNVHGKLYFITTITSHVFADIEFHDGEEASVRLSGNELGNLMLFLAARNLSSRMGVESSSSETVPIIPGFPGF